MRVKILTSSALVNEEDSRWAGLGDEVDVPKERGEYLVSIGAAVPVAKDDGAEVSVAPQEVNYRRPVGESKSEKADESSSSEKKAAPKPRSSK